MKKYKLVLLLSLILIGVINTILITNVKGAYDDDIDFIFENNNFYNSTNPSINNSKNIKDYTQYTGHYNATYSFENDLDGSLPNGWSNDAIIYNQIDYHSKVLGLNGSGKYTDFFFSDSNSGFIEFWYYSTDMTPRTNLYLYDGGTSVIAFRSEIEKFRYTDDIGFNDWSALDNTWYHLLIIWYSNNTVDIYCNGIKEIDGLNFQTNMTNGIDEFEFRMYNSHYSYIDSFGYFLDINYNIGNNMVPYFTTNIDIKEVDKYLFAYSDFLTLYDVGTDNPSNWTDIEPDADWTNVVEHFTDDNDRLVKMEQEAPNPDDTGLEKEFYINEGILNITWNVNLTEMNTGEFSTKIYSIDDTLISDIHLEGNTLEYNLGGEQLLYTGIITEVNYEFNLYINYYDDISILIFYADDIYIDTYYIPLIASGKNGLGKVQIYIDASISDMIAYVDYIGIYVNSSSISEEFGYMRNYDTIGNTIFLDKTNLFSFDVIATNMSFHISRYPYLGILTDIYQLNPLDTYNSSSISNLYSLKDPDNIQNPEIWTRFYGQIQVHSMSFDGVKITENNNTYYPSYIFNNVDGNISYFYVSGNRLYFTNYYDNFSDLEYIQCIIDIDNQITVNRSLNYHHFYNGIGSSNLVLNYSDSFDIFYLSTYFKSENIFIYQENVITQFEFTATDTNNSGYTNKTALGYIGSLSLNFITNLDLLITTTNLIDLMIPLIVILIPSLAILNRYGKTGFLIIFLLMSVILISAQMIPNWLFFIICFSVSYLLISKREGSEVL